MTCDRKHVDFCWIQTCKKKFPDEPPVVLGQEKCQEKPLTIYLQLLTVKYINRINTSIKFTISKFTKQCSLFVHRGVGFLCKVKIRE